MHTIGEAKAPGCVPSGQTHSRVDLTGLLEGFNDIINKVLHVVPRLQQGLYKYQLLGIANIYRLRRAANTVLSICGPAESHACPKGSIHVSMGGNQAQRCEVIAQIPRVNGVLVGLAVCPLRHGWADFHTSAISSIGRGL